MTVVANVQNDSKIESRKGAKLGTFCSSVSASLSEFVWHFLRKIRFH